MHPAEGANKSRMVRQKKKIAHQMHVIVPCGNKKKTKEHPLTPFPKTPALAQTNQKIQDGKKRIKKRKHFRYEDRPSQSAVSSPRDSNSSNGYFVHPHSPPDAHFSLSPATASTPAVRQGYPACYAPCPAATPSALAQGYPRVPDYAIRGRAGPGLRGDQCGTCCLRRD